MKKQLLIAAVAATMTSAAMADISIAGSAKVNYTNTDFDASGTADNNAFSREMDLMITGKTGDTTVVMNFGDLDNVGDQPDLEDSYVATSFEGVSIKAGTWDNGNNVVRASARSDNKLSLSTTVSGVTVTYDAQEETATTTLSDTVKVAAEIAGVAVSYKDTHTGEDISVSTTVSGITASYFASNKDLVNTDRSVIELSGSFGGVDITVGQASADSAITIDGDSWMGDFEDAAFTNSTNALTTNAYDLSQGQDVKAVKLSTAMAGNTVAYTRTSIDGVSGEDTTINKFVVTRPLANGTTFEATYTTLDDKVSTTTDSDKLDLELAVKF